MDCPKCGASLPDRTDVCPSCGTEPTAEAAARETGLSMKRYRFMTRFGVWFSTLVCLYSGIAVLFGWIYDGDADEAYALFGSLRYLDRIAGALYLALALLTVIAAVRMLKRKKGAPTLLSLCYVCTIVVSAAYVFVSYAILHKHIGFGEIFLSTVALPLIASLVMLCCSFFCFRKSAALFVN